MVKPTRREIEKYLLNNTPTCSLQHPNDLVSLACKRWPWLKKCIAWDIAWDLSEECKRDHNMPDVDARGMG